MRTFTQKQSRIPQAAPFNKAGSGLAFAESRQVNTTKNQLHNSRNQGSANAAYRFSHDFSQISMHAPVKGVIQTKLDVNTPGDIYEQEADQVAEQVMSMATPLAFQGQRPATEDKPVQRKISGYVQVQAAPPIVDEVLRSPWQPLDTATRAFMEPRFGWDFSRVRVHADSRAEGQGAAASAAGMQAQAYTVGPHVVFGGWPLSTGNQRRAAPHRARASTRGPAGALDGTTECQRAHGRRHSRRGRLPPSHEPRDANSDPAQGRDARRRLRRPVRLQSLAGTDPPPERHGPRAHVFQLPLAARRAHRVRDYGGKLVQGNQTVELQAIEQPGKAPSHFEARMKALIDLPAVLPLRLTNRHGLLGTPATGFHNQVDADAWTPVMLTSTICWRAATSVSNRCSCTF